MTDLLLVPIHIDALQVGSSGASIVAPASDFAKMPYKTWVTQTRGHGQHAHTITSSTFVNSDQPFISEQVIRKAAALAELSQNYHHLRPGIHLHWSLPDALTTMRADPKSGDRLRFPHVPNRWLISRKSKTATGWQIDHQWVVESDFLYPENSTSSGLKPEAAITFPIISAERYRQVLTNLPLGQEPSDPSTVTDPNDKAIYNAPFRYMGRAQPIADWQKSPRNQSEYLGQYMADGLTAVGYGDPHFAAVYSNCYSIFGYCDTQADNSKPYRYELLGWYENPDEDCLDLFAVLARQKRSTELYHALHAEYKWRVDKPPTAFPSLSVYHASIDVMANLTANPALKKATQQTGSPPKYQNLAITVGNSGTEALAADVAHTLARNSAAERIVMEDQLEAIGLRKQLHHTTIDLADKFQEARHTKGFNAAPGGTVWTVQERNTGKRSTQNSEQPIRATSTLPLDLAHLLNEVNLAQATYDQAWQEIETLRHRLFADWIKFENTYHPQTTDIVYINPDDVPAQKQHKNNPTLDPTYTNMLHGTFTPQGDFIGDVDEVLAYVSQGSLADLQQKLAFAGELKIGKDAAGHFTLTAVDASQNPYVENRFTLAQGLLLQLNRLIARLDTYNAEPKTLQAQHAYTLLRKAGPRFWEPNEPVVLLKGDVVPSTLRHGEDGRANEDGTLTCQVLHVAGQLGSGSLSEQLLQNDPQKIFQSIQQAIEGMRPTKITPNTIGFCAQSEKPWHPVMLEWEVSVWPETTGMTTGMAQAGQDYTPSFLDTNYQSTLNEPDLKMAHQPDQFANKTKTENVYTGRAPLTPSASNQLLFNIEQYLISLTLFDLKEMIVNGNMLSDQVDYQLNVRLIAWAKPYLSLTNIPQLVDPATFSGQEKETKITQQKSLFTQWSRTQNPFRKTVVTHNKQGKPIKKQCLVDLGDVTRFPPHWYNGKPVLVGSVSHPHIQTFAGLSRSKQVEDPLFTAISALSLAQSSNVLAQSLGGFNDALLMRQQTLQLPIFDLQAMETAIGSGAGNNDSVDKYKNFARDVAAALAGKIRSSPVSYSDFMPIRSGILQIDKLYLVDTFGQVLDVSPTTILPSDTLTISRNLVQPTAVTPQQDAGYAYLGPRVVQGARLNFRWLAANSGSLNSPDEPEMNDHPATTPICGWLVPNNLDNSLMVYDTKGLPLGSILTTGVWEPAPGTINRVRLTAIPNRHLRRLVTYLSEFSQQNSGYWSSFLTALDSALEHIEPESFAQHEALALLIGRPIAVVRATLGFQLQGKPALNQRWRAFLNDMYHSYLDGRVSNRFSDVTFPIRLGEYQQLNDGLVGYWIEAGDRFQDNLFYASQASPINDPHIVTHHTKPIRIEQSLVAPPKKLTMLVDPRGVVHATSSVLPTKQISIPPDQYAGILQKLAVTFMTTPILTDHQGIQLTLPQESGYSWSWLTRPSGTAWQQTDKIQPTHNTLRFSPQRLVEGWLKLTPDDNDK